MRDLTDDVALMRPVLDALRASGAEDRVPGDGRVFACQESDNNA